MEASLEQQPAGDAPADAPQEAWPPHVPPLHMAGRALAAAAGSVAAALGVGVSMGPYKTGLLACFTSALVVGLSLRGTFSLDTCKLGFVAGLSSAIVGALKLRGTLWAVVLSLAISFVTMIPLRQVRMRSALLAARLALLTPTRRSRSLTGSAAASRRFSPTSCTPSCTLLCATAQAA